MPLINQHELIPAPDRNKIVETASSSANATCALVSGLARDDDTLVGKYSHDYATSPGSAPDILENAPQRYFELLSWYGHTLVVGTQGG